MLNAFTVDVEDYYQVAGFADRIQREDWPQYPSRVVASTQCLLRLLDKHGVQATFFILGYVADQHPELVRDIAQAGHDIGTHSYWHRLVYQMSPEEFRADLRRSIDALESITGKRVNAYRAPSFSITAESLWALDILREEGIEYDSSIFPVHHDRYGIPNAERFPHRLASRQGELWEFPPSVAKLGGLNLPVAGGGYFRLYPEKFTSFWLKRINEHDRRPFMFYVHPWEVDPEQPRMQGSWKSRFRHYQNLHTTEQKLDRLLGRFSFGTMNRALEDCRREAPCKDVSSFTELANARA